VNEYNSIPKRLILPKMINLHTFTLVQSIFSDIENNIKWSTIEILTGPNVMPVLRRMNVAILITIDDICCINRSSLFMDDRRIDIQFAFIIPDTSLGNEIRNYLPHGSRFYPRQIVGVTCVVSYLSRNYEELTNINCYVSNCIIT